MVGVFLLTVALFFLCVCISAKVVGAPATGKSAIVQRYCAPHQEFSLKYTPTIGKLWKRTFESSFPPSQHNYLIFFFWLISGVDVDTVKLPLTKSSKFGIDFRVQLWDVPYAEVRWCILYVP